MLTLVRWCLDPAVMATLTDDELSKRPGSPRRTLAQRKRLSALKNKTPEFHRLSVRIVNRI